MMTRSIVLGIMVVAIAALFFVNTLHFARVYFVGEKVIAKGREAISLGYELLDESDPTKRVEINRKRMAVIIERNKLVRERNALTWSWEQKAEEMDESEMSML